MRWPLAGGLCEDHKVLIFNFLRYFQIFDPERLRLSFIKNFLLKVFWILVDLWKIENRSSRTNFFQGKELFSKNSDLIKGVKIKFKIITENMQTMHEYSFTLNRFYGLMSSQRPSASVGVNIFSNLTLIFEVEFRLLWRSKSERRSAPEELNWDFGANSEGVSG